MRTVAVTGASGLVGTRLVKVLRVTGVQVRRLVRRTVRDDDEVFWDPANGTVDVAGLRGVDAVVHLAGEHVAARRWNAEFKQRIRDSRVESTRTLCRALLTLPEPPKVLISASGIGYYGNRGADLLTEAEPPGSNFLAQVCQEWEQAARAVDERMRSVQLRIGMVLAKDGGALEAMLPVFRWGVGGKLSSGRQYTSWISATDLARVIVHCIQTDRISGPVNAVSPAPVTNAEFTKTLGRVLRRPSVLPVPAFALRLGLGELAGELLAGQHAVPVVLEKSAFVFQHPELEAALRAELNG